ncbi:MAG: serine protease [Candidatus Moranbacteria bacterium]|nr:serine protease [Candidatus Moranbacteria bacterium]
MNKIEICKKIKNVTRKILLKDGDNYISAGTGILINSEGFILTANHVIEKYKQLKQPLIIVNTFDNDGSLQPIPYTIDFSDVSLDVGTSGVVKPLGIDLAILRPIENLEGLEFMELEESIPDVGEDVIMAGFPDEINPTLDFNKSLNYEGNAELVAKHKEIENHFKFSMNLIMAKSGMIGAVHGIKISAKFLDKSVSIDGASYWIDNASTFGASGGPVVNYSGKLVGIVCQKGLTSLNGIEKIIPSGTTMALSHKLITWKISKQ